MKALSARGTPRAGHGFRAIGALRSRRYSGFCICTTLRTGHDLIRKEGSHVILPLYDEIDQTIEETGRKQEVAMIGKNRRLAEQAELFFAWIWPAARELLPRVGCGHAWRDWGSPVRLD